MPINPFRSVGAQSTRTPPLRRSCLAVPGSDPKMLRRAAEADADQLFLDLEDAVAPHEKKDARSTVVEALDFPPQAGHRVYAAMADGSGRSGGAASSCSYSPVSGTGRPSAAA